VNRSLIRKQSHFYLPDYRTFISGILIVLAFPPWNLWPLIWLSLIPWLVALRRSQSAYAACIQGLWLSYFMTLGGFYWIVHALQEFGNLPWILAVLCLQLFCFFGQPQFFIFAPLLVALKLSQPKEYLLLTPLQTLLLAVCIALGYTGIDQISPKLFLDTLGHAFFLAKNLRQLADLGGPFLLTFLVVLVNFTLWKLFENRKTI
jgi:apolipoprotein N-acyltransferase